MTASISQSSAERLDLLLRLTQSFTSTLNLDEILLRLMDEVITATRAERGFVMLVDAGGKLTFRAARGMDQQTIAAPEFQISQGVVEQVAREGQAVHTHNAQADDRFKRRESVFNLKLRSILCVPLKLKARVLGVIYVDNRLHVGLFTPDDLSLLSAIAASAAIAIENARLYQIAVDQGRMERELHLARQVQSSLLLHTMPQVPGWNFAARWLPAREVAGDYYDFIPLSAAIPVAGATPGLGLVIADVTDKGMPAALFMAFTRTVTRVSVDRAGSPAEGISYANRLICAENTGGLFVSLFYGQLQPATGLLTYVNAGHNLPLLYQHATGLVTSLKRTGMPLGVDTEAAYAQQTLQLLPGDILLLYTDGVTDALNAHEEEFGLQRLQLALHNRPAGSAAEVIGAVEQSLNTFTEGVAPFDDVTLVVAKRW
jgi:phosphoserine phosphatase RsbU/P